ncbi:ROK family transcriptional regulator [Kineococcus sp. TBRC 1896]|uniref:ROK family transcriptional regulator n=1 Tax=Kineococcus mangrovi TaxID=1660183 RepID=A0ABV4I3V6_9ACTN
MNDAAPRRLKGRTSAETRSAVLDLIRAGEGISRAELALASSLTEATISKIVRQLLDEGIIIEAGRGRSTGGKRPTLLTLNTGRLYALGVALDRWSTVLVLCGLNGSVVDRTVAAGSGSQSPRRVVSRAAGHVRTLLQRNGVDPSDVVGLGVATSGRRRGPDGWGVDAAIADVWDTFDTASELEARTGIRVVMENDANCAALGSFWTGTDARRDFMTVYMSTGIGAGIVLGGSLYRGASGNAGEIGHVVVDPEGAECWCGGRGCLETVGPPRGVVRTVAADPVLSRRFLPGGPAQDRGASEPFGQIARAYRAGDGAAEELIENAAQQVATVVLGLVNTLDLDEVRLAGPGFATLGEVYVRAVRERLAASAVSRGLHDVVVELGEVGPDVTAIGAASLVLHSSLTPHYAARL